MDVALHVCDAVTNFVTTQTCCLAIAAPPKFTKSDMEETMTLKAGQSTAIEIPCSGYPQPKVTWQYNKTKLPDVKRIREETIIGMTSLTLAKVIRTDSGSYTVTLENEFGQASFTVKLIVLGEDMY